MTEGRLWGFALWMAGGGLFFLLGLAAFVSKKAVGFWANIKTVPMKDKKGYNRAVGKLWIVYGIVFMLLGIPLLWEHNSMWIIISVLGVLAESIAAMAVYLLAIQSKYEKEEGN